MPRNAAYEGAKESVNKRLLELRTEAEGAEEEGGEETVQDGAEESSNSGPEITIYDSAKDTEA